MLEKNGAKQKEQTLSLLVMTYFLETICNTFAFISHMSPTKNVCISLYQEVEWVGHQGHVQT
jgi:hypothetical protein